MSLANGFSRIILSSNIEKDDMEMIIPFRNSRDVPTSVLDNYNWQGPELATYSFYEYIKVSQLVNY